MTTWGSKDWAPLEEAPARPGTGSVGRRLWSEETVARTLLHAGEHQAGLRSQQRCSLASPYKPPQWLGSLIIKQLGSGRQTGPEVG